MSASGFLTADQTLPAVSVVVPTKGRPELLDGCLLALLDQTYPLRDVEVIVVDDGADPATRDAVQRRAGGAIDVGLTLHYLTSSGKGPAAARNVGWRSAKGSIIAFTDDDCLPSPEWLQAGIESMLRTSADGVSGRISVPVPPTPTDYELSAARLEEGRFVTANCFYKRELLTELGGFDERFEVAWREDTDLMFSSLRAGKRLETCHAAVVEHPVRPAGWGISVRQQRKTLFNPLLYRKHPRLYRQRIQAKPNWQYYIGTGAGLFAIAGLVLRRRGLAVLCGTTWLLMWLNFSRKRLIHTSRAPSHVLEMLATSAVIPPLAIYWRFRGNIRFRAWLI
ncbi:MAG TPA: glycosyltransferase [Chloroflexota bacterium]|nr:glycosyltransferase [Chloroflexota bacterium]